MLETNFNANFNFIADAFKQANLHNKNSFVR
jgi:hypothetical protein